MPRKALAAPAFFSATLAATLRASLHLCPPMALSSSHSHQSRAAPRSLASWLGSCGLMPTSREYCQGNPLVWGCQSGPICPAFHEVAGHADSGHHAQDLVVQRGLCTSARHTPSPASCPGTRASQLPHPNYGEQDRPSRIPKRTKGHSVDTQRPGYWEA